MATNFLTPYAVAGTRIPAAALRYHYQAGFGGGSGIANAGDYFVRPLSTPGNGIQVGAGLLLIQSRNTGESRQTYGVPLPNAGTVEGLTGTPSGTPPNGGTVLRRDMVIVEILDPNHAKHYTDPAAWEPGEAVRVAIVQGVPLTATTVEEVSALNNVTCYAIAVIDYPPSTETISLGMIKNVAQVHSPKRDHVTLARPRVAADDGKQMYLNNAAAYSAANGGEAFPGGAGVANGFEFTIPKFATRLIIDARWMSIIYAANRDPRGEFWMEYGDEYRAKGWPGKQDYEFATQRFYFNAPGGNNASTDNWLLMDNKTIPARLRGKTVYAHFKAGFVHDGGGAQSVMMKATGGLGARIDFVETNADWESAF